MYSVNGFVEKAPALAHVPRLAPAYAELIQQDLGDLV